MSDRTDYQADYYSKNKKIKPMIQFMQERHVKSQKLKDMIKLQNTALKQRYNRKREQVENEKNAHEIRCTQKFLQGARGI